MILSHSLINTSLKFTCGAGQPHDSASENGWELKNTAGQALGLLPGMRRTTADTGTSAGTLRRRAQSHGGDDAHSEQSPP